MARPSSARALKGANRNHSSGRAKAAPISAARAEKAMRPTKAGKVSFIWSALLLAADAEVDQGERQIDQHHDDSNGCAFAELEIIKGHAVIVDGDQLGSVARPPIGEEERREGVEGPHGDQDQIGDNVSSDQRQADIPELLP